MSWQYSLGDQVYVSDTYMRDLDAYALQGHVGTIIKLSIAGEDSEVRIRIYDPRLGRQRELWLNLNEIRPHVDLGGLKLETKISVKRKNYSYEVKYADEP